jgi:exo-beta-1,3-glucanase (GH17 family)
MLPYWEGVEVEAAVEYVVDKMKLLEKTFPGKEIVIDEVGWPSEGRTRQSAVASTSSQRCSCDAFSIVRSRKATSTT